MWVKRRAGRSIAAAWVVSTRMALGGVRDEAEFVVTKSYLHWFSSG
ncbi:hypothetical protein OK016_14655 [Vibrio chagasii]|nr:hypothetical protein [Vibrio chagasii]